MSASSEPQVVTSLRLALDCYSRGDFDGAAALLEPDVELVPPGGQTPIRGRERLRAWMEPDAFAEQTVELIDFTVEGDKVLFKQRVRSRGAGSGISFDWTGWGVWTVGPRGLFTRMEIFLEHEEAEALAAAGLSAG